MPSYLISEDREKLLNALAYFSENVQFAGKLKLFKMLYFLDFLHYQRTGRSVTGQQYEAWRMGPVPVDLYREWEHPSRDFNEVLRKQSVKFKNGMVRQGLRPLQTFDADLFSRLELELMQQLAKRHFSDKAEQMKDASHFETGPWHEIFEVRGLDGGAMPYELALQRRGAQEDMDILGLANEVEEIKANYS